MLKGYKESLEKAIPDNWEIGILSDVSEIKFSNVDKITSSDEAPILLCNYLDVYNNEYIDDRIEFMPATATDKEIEKFALKKGDVIITKDSETPDDTAKPAVVVQDLTNVLCGYHLALIRPDSQRVDSVFLGKMLSSKIVNHQFERLAQGLTRFGLEVSSIKNALIAIPPQQEQHKIAGILSTVDETIEKTDAIIQETQQLKKGLMQKLFTEGIGHTRFKETKIGRIPEEWEVVRFNQCLQKTKQKDPTKKPDEKFTYIDVSAVSNEFFKIVESKTILGKDAPSRARKGIKTGDTIYATVRPYLRRVAFVPSELDGEICSTGYCVLRPKSEEIFHRFVFQLMLTHRVNEYLESLQAGTSYPAISDSDVYQMLIPKPPLPEQRRIAEILSEVDAKIETEQAFKSELEKLKKGLMQVLLTGEVRVKV